MPARLVALDEGSDIPLDRTMVVVGRHPQCDARLDSLRISRHHCCMTQDNGDVVVRDLGSTNGIRINGQRVELGRLRPGDELSIAHIRYRFDCGRANEQTLIDGVPINRSEAGPSESNEIGALSPLEVSVSSSSEVPLDCLSSDGLLSDENPLAQAVRGLLPAGVADRCRIQVIVQMRDDAAAAEKLDACRPNSSP